MFDNPHLILPRVTFEIPRRKSGYGRPPKVSFKIHGNVLKEQVDKYLQEARKIVVKEIDPALILRIHLDPGASIQEDEWERFGLSLVSVGQNKTYILFSDDLELNKFKNKLSKYKGGPKGDQKNAPYNGIFASIMKIEKITPKDKIGRLFNYENIQDIDDISDDENYIIDVQLWDFGTISLNRKKLDEVIKYVKDNKGKVTDVFLHDSLVLIRVNCKGSLLKNLLTSVYSISLIDKPPKPSIAINEYLQLSIKDFPKIPAPPKDAPSVAVLDSGISEAHPLLKSAIGESVPFCSGVADGTDKNGHGTMVSGLALYGDINDCICAKLFSPSLRLFSAKVMNDKCEFDEEHLITTQMNDAISYFKKTYNCRIFNLSLGDKRLLYKGGKVTHWTSILDTISRNLDVIIVVSSGNLSYDSELHGEPEKHLRSYPKYLLDVNAKIIEPATGALVLSVGSLAHTNDVPPGKTVHLRPFALQDQPSPFTRSGFGINNAIKPEVIEYGGNFAYDGLVRSLNTSLATLSIISLNNQYLKRLFRTDIGTSFAAPRVSYLAATLLGLYQKASANLIRALIVASAAIPKASLDLFESFGSEALLRVCGYGKPLEEYAGKSSDNRVMLYNEGVLKYDHMDIYKVPIPEEFMNTTGQKTITVTLAFDPPVRHTRLDYLGVTMSFRLIRGKSPQEVEAFFIKMTKEEKEANKNNIKLENKYNCHMMPGPTLRENGTLQKAIFSTTRNFKTEYGEDYYLVIRCEKKWAREEVFGNQKYAIVVTIEHSEPLDIYTKIRQRVEIPVRVRAKL